MFEFIQSQFETNAFFQGGFVLTLLGSGLVLGKGLLIKLWNLIVSKTLYTLSVKNENTPQVYSAVLFQEEARINKRVMNFRFLSENSWRGGVQKVPVGFYYIFKFPFLIKFSFIEERIEHATYAYGAYAHRVNISGFFAKNAIEKIVNDSISAYNMEKSKMNDYIDVLKIENSKIDVFCKTKPKDISDIVLPDGKIEAIKSLLDEWKANAENYRKIGIPHKLGFLLYGKPGTGKSTLAYSIAKYLKFNICPTNIMSVSKNGFTYSNTVYLLDDIDRELTNPFQEVEDTSSTTEKKKNRFVMKELLETLDARTSAENVIVILTCNNIDVIDPVIYRPGRIDMSVLFDNPTKEMVERFMSNFYRTPVVLNRFIPQRPMSYYQICCVRNMKDVAKAKMEAESDSDSAINFESKICTTYSLS